MLLGDFGLASLKPRTEGEGTPRYQGPEWPVVTAKTDVWGLGAFTHVLGHGRAPVDLVPHGVDTKDWEKTPRSKNPRPLPGKYSDELNRNMMGCLRLDPNDRVNSRELVRHLLRDRETVWARRTAAEEAAAHVEKKAANKVSRHSGNHGGNRGRHRDRYISKLSMKNTDEAWSTRKSHRVTLFSIGDLSACTSRFCRTVGEFINDFEEIFGVDVVVVLRI